MLKVYHFEIFSTLVCQLAKTRIILCFIFHHIYFIVSFSGVILRQGLVTKEPTAVYVKIKRGVMVACCFCVLGVQKPLVACDVCTPVSLARHSASVA